MTIDLHNEDPEKRRHSEEYRDALEKQRRYDEELVQRRARETPYSPQSMKGRMPWGCWMILVVIAIAAVKGILWLFKRSA